MCAENVKLQLGGTYMFKCHLIKTLLKSRDKPLCEAGLYECGQVPGFSFVHNLMSR